MIHKISNYCIETDLNLSLFKKKIILDSSYPDIVIKREEVRFLNLSDSISSQYSINMTKSYGEIFKRKIGRFIVKCGKEIIYEPAMGVNPINLELYIYTHVLGFLFYQRNHLVLHASSVEKKGKSFFFCGRSGAGKSTIVSKLLNNFNLLSEDLCCISNNDNSVFPSLPYLKLAEKDLSKPFVHKESTINDKRNRSIFLTDNIPTDKNTFSSGFFLKICNKQGIEKISRSEALTNILSNSFISDPIQNSEQEFLLELISNFVQKSDFYNIYRRDDEDYNFLEIAKLLDSKCN